jgi:AcrR family transcriptional regulator
MRRVSKSSEERKRELISAAQRLFLTKGYERTAVSDIVKEVNIAQGTFCYHFRSKNDILEEVARKSIASLVEKVRGIAERGGEDAVGKLNELLGEIAGYADSNRELAVFLHQESNLIIHNKLTRIAVAGLAPLLAHIIQQRKSEGIFTSDYPTETAKFIVLAMTEIFHDPGFMRDPDRTERARTTVEQCVEGILGVEEDFVRMNF